MWKFLNILEAFVELCNVKMYFKNMVFLHLEESVDEQGRENVRRLYTLKKQYISLLSGME